MSTKYWGEFSDTSEEEIEENKSPIPLSPIPFRPVKFYQPCLIEENELLWEFNNEDIPDNEFSLLTLDPLDRPGTSKETTSQTYRPRYFIKKDRNEDRIPTKESIHHILRTSLCAIFDQRGIDATTNIVLDVMVDIVENFFSSLFTDVKRQLDSVYSSRFCNLKHPLVPITVLLPCIEHALEQFPNLNFQRLHRYLCKSQAAIAKKDPPNKLASEQAHYSKRFKDKKKSSLFCKSNKNTEYTADAQPSSLCNQLKWQLSSSEEEILNEKDDNIQNRERLGLYGLKTSSFPGEKNKNSKKPAPKKKKLVGPKKKIKKKLRQKRKKIKTKCKRTKKRNVKKTKAKKESKLVKLSYSFPTYLNEKIYEPKVSHFLSDPILCREIDHMRNEGYRRSLELIKCEMEMYLKDSLTEDDIENYKRLLKEDECSFAEYSENFLKTHRFMSETYVKEEETPIVFQHYPPSEMEQKLKEEETFKNRVLAISEVEERHYSKVLKKYPIYEIATMEDQMHVQRRQELEEEKLLEDLMKNAFDPRKETDLESDIKSDVFNLMIKKSKEKGRNMPPLIKTYSSIRDDSSHPILFGAFTSASKPPYYFPTFLNVSNKRHPLIIAPLASPDYVPLRGPFTQPTFGVTSKGNCFPMEKHPLSSLQPLEDTNAMFYMKQKMGKGPSRTDYAPPISMSDLTISEKKKILGEEIKRFGYPKKKISDQQIKRKRYYKEKMYLRQLKRNFLLQHFI